MLRPAPEPNYFLKDATVCIAEQLLHVDASKLVSLKVRPVFDSGWNAYVYADEYTDILNETSNFSLLNVSPAPGDCTQQCGVDEGPEFLLIKRATGPEIVTVVRAAAVLMGVTRTLVELVAIMVKIINERNEQKKAGVRVDRFYTVSAVSIEVRSCVGGKRLIKVNLPDEVSMDSQLLARTLECTLQELFAPQALTKVAGEL